MIGIRRIVALVGLLAACTSAPRAVEYEFDAQIVDIRPGERVVFLTHEDIPGFMTAMTMPFNVQDAGLLEGKEEGDLVRAVLRVAGSSAYLTTLTPTGHRPVDRAAIGPLITAADLLKPGDQVPRHPFIDQNVMPRPMASLRGHRVGLTFMFTRCPLPDACVVMDRNFATVQDAIRKNPALADVRLVSVTLDPDFDTPSVLKEHATRLQADPSLWYFVTGTRYDVRDFALRFGVTAASGGPETIVIHSLGTAVIDADGRLVRIRPGNGWTPGQLIADLESSPSAAR